MTPPDSHYSLDQPHHYEQWRRNKLDHYPATVEQLIVPISSLHAPTEQELRSIRTRLVQANMAVFSLRSPDTSSFNSLSPFAKQLGLTSLNHNEGSDMNGVTKLCIAQSKNWRGTYIPYTSRAINWHSDGYYNANDKQIRAFILYCEQAADEGGKNQLIDHEMVYLHLRDINPDYISALMQDDVMMIPANDVSDDAIARPDRYGPVFSVDSDNHLHMRYTARKRNVVWKKSSLVQQAVLALEDFLASDTAWIFTTRLEPGQGVICNNVLHTRSAFSDSEHHSRIYYRLRFYNRAY